MSEGPDDPRRLPSTLKTLLETAPPAVAIRYIRRVNGLPAPDEARGITTRELSMGELARELELLRKLDPETGADAVQRPSQPVTLEMSLDEILPPAEQQLLTRGEPTRESLAAALHSDATPTVIATTAELFPEERREAARISRAPDGLRFKGAAPSVAPPPSLVDPAPSRVGKLVGTSLVAVALVTTVVFTQPPDTPDAEPLQRAGEAVSASVAAIAAPVPAAEQADELALNASPRRAAQLYDQGHLKEALAEYRMLAALHPEEPAYAQAARSLALRLIAACRRARPAHRAACQHL